MKHIEILKCYNDVVRSMDALLFLLNQQVIIVKFEKVIFDDVILYKFETDGDYEALISRLIDLTTNS